MLNWIDSFDLYGTDINNLASRYQNVIMPFGSFVSGRTGGRALFHTGTYFTTSTLNIGSEWFIGFAFQPQNLSVGTILLVFGTQVAHEGFVTFQPTANSTPLTGTLQVWRSPGPVHIGTSNTQFQMGTWYYIEIFLSIAPTTGQFILRVNQATDLNLTGLNTGTGTINNFSFNSVGTDGSIGYYLDDLYICDSTGSVNNTFLGDVVVEGLLPFAGGLYSGWTPTPSNYPNFACVDDVFGPDGDNTYVSTNTVGNQDAYDFGGPHRVTGSINAISCNLFARSTDSTVHQIAPLLHLNGTDYTGVFQNVLSTSYANISQIYEQNPATSAPWTPSDLTNGQIGVQLIS